MLMLNVPATLGLVVLATPIVQLLFERGQFTAADTAATAAALQCYAVGLVGYSAARITSPVFYTLAESRVPVVVGTVSVAVNLALSIALVQAIGFLGLALGTSLAALSNGALLLWLLRRRLQGIDGRRLSATFFKVLASSLVMAAAAFAAEQALRQFAPERSVIMQLSRLVAAIAAALAALVIAAKILHIREFDESISLVSGRVRKLLGSR
jgi:putative peptidoglycan lipid II flippase